MVKCNHIKLEQNEKCIAQYRLNIHLSVVFFCYYRELLYTKRCSEEKEISINTITGNIKLKIKFLFNYLGNVRTEG